MSHAVAARAARPASAVPTVVALLALLAALLVPAGTAGAQPGPGSIVFIRGGNVWIAAGDAPSTARAVTTDGSPADPYSWPTQDDAGRIMAVRGSGEQQVLVRMDQSGTPLQAPFRPSGYEGIEQLSNLHLLPTGEAVAVTTASSQCGGGPGDLCGGSDLLAADGSGSFSPAYISVGASWYSADSVVASNGGDFTIYQAGAAEEQLWFDGCPLTDDFSEPCITAGHPEITRAGDRMVAVDNGSSFIPPALYTWDLAAPPPARPELTCTITEEGGGWYGPSWSPDGSSLLITYGEGVFGEPPVKEPGIYTFTGIGTDPCEAVQASQVLLLADASQASWSAAPLGGAPVDPGPVDPGDPGTPGRDLVDGERIDGGGRTDPIAQAIATSRLLFADGAADRVVLATADRFPDALAGAALAGDDGPILFTSGQGALDPRTAAEIARVTGGDGVVLTLGGVAAVSEDAAAAARAAGGDVPCTAPLPASCRFAGDAREQTAALISEVVLAEHPGDEVLIARRDDPADAITGGAYAARAGVPILLTASTSLHPDTAAFLTGNGIRRAIVLGGTAAVDEPTYQALPVAERARVAGAERTATTVAVARDLWAAAGQGRGGGHLLVNVRDAAGWQTALSAAVISAVHDVPQIGVESPPAGLSPAVSAYLGEVAGGLVVVGDEGLVSEAQLAEAVAARG